MSDKKFVLFVEGADNGCNWYRIKQPYQNIQERENFCCASTVDLKYRGDLRVWLDQSDIIVTQCHSDSFLTMAKEGKKKIVFDFDDNIFDISPYNPAYKDYGINEVEIELNGEKKKLWKDGHNGFDLKRNTEKMLKFIEMLQYASVVTTPSSILAEKFRENGAKNVRVIRNYLDFSNWYPVNIVKDEFVRIGYQGGWSHYEDWSEISDVLKIVMEKHKNVKLVLMGQSYGGFLKKLPADRIETHEWASIDAYPYKFKTLNIDIGICPLADIKFNVCKSEIKLEEYSSLKIPTVASNTPPYNLAIKHEETGLIASNTVEWVDYLSRLIEDKEYRLKLGQTAHDFVRENYDIKKNVEQYENCFRSLFDRELIVV